MHVPENKPRNCLNPLLLRHEPILSDAYTFTTNYFLIAVKTGHVRPALRAPRYRALPANYLRQMLRSWFFHHRCRRKPYFRRLPLSQAPGTSQERHPTTPLSLICLGTSLDNRAPILPLRKECVPTAIRLFELHFGQPVQYRTKQARG